MTKSFQKTILRCVITTLAFPLFLFGASPAGAQQLEEIIVTANKREENVQEIGLTIIVLDQDQMQKLGINDVSRLQFVVPSLTYADVGNDAKFNLRGANSTNTFGDASSIVGAYVDGVYKPHASQQTRQFFDVERLEFLMGPQGTLYGRNTFAGALNLHTNRPNTESVEGNIILDRSRWETLRTEGFLNVPLGDTTALRLAGFTENGNGYIENNAGQNAAAPDSSGVRLSGLWNATDNLDFLLRLSYIQEQGTTAGLFGYKTDCRNVDVDGLTDAFGAFKDCQNSERGSSQIPRGDIGEHNISQEFLPDSDLYEAMGSLEIDWDIGPVSFRSITSYTDFQNEIPSDFDFSPTPNQIGGTDEYVESFTQEFIFNSNYDSKLQWTAGAYYSKDESQIAFWVYQQTVREDNSVRPEVTNSQGTFPVLNGTFLDPMGISTQLPCAPDCGGTFLNDPFADNHNFDSTTMAVFAQAEFSLTDSLRFIGGARYTDEEKDAYGGGSNGTVNGPVTVLFTEGDSPAIVPQTRLEAFAYDPSAPGSTTSEADYDNTSWKVGIEWDLNDAMMFYVTGATGWLAGAINNNGTSTEDQESEMWEVGMKSILLDGKMLLNLAVYDTEYTNLLAQLQTINAQGIAITTTRNGGVIEAQGIELELQYLPTEAWELGLTAAYLDAQFGEFFQTSPYQLNRGLLTVPEDMKGETPGWSPDLRVNFYTDYTFNLANGSSLVPGLLISYSDAYNTSNLYSLDQNHDQDSYTKTDLRLTWFSPSENFRVAAYVENLEDEAVKSRGNGNSQDLVQTGYLPPKNYGVLFSIGF